MAVMRSEFSEPAAESMLRADLTAKPESVLPFPSETDCSGNGFAVPTRIATFVSFDRRLSATTYHQRPDRYRQLEASLGNMPRIARAALHDAVRIRVTN